ncbi:MAG: CDP-diacylglycerol--serine O-phosphatidyltransferase [Candidatus Binataceae bacterium]
MSRTKLRSQRENARMRVISSHLRERRKKITAPLRRGVYLVPVTITSLGLLAGFYSLISAVNAHFELAAVMIMVAFICDGLDGRVARASSTSSQFGVEYDSLSDVVAFGVAPAGLAYTWALKPLGAIGIVLAGLYVVAAALRLARFNIQTVSSDKRRFTGLPVPGAAAMMAGLVLAYSYFELNSPLILGIFMAPLTLALAALMISRIPYPSFKSLHLKKRAQIELVVAVLVVAALLFVMPQFTVFVLAAAYVLSGPFLLIRGERVKPAPPVLRPVPSSSTALDHSKAANHQTPVAP